MKPIFTTLALVVAAGCAKSPSPAATAGGPSPLTQKLQAMTPEQRTKYVKAHMDEVTASAGVAKVALSASRAGS